MGQKAHKWTKAQIALLGKLTDAEAGARIGLHPATVARKRLMLGIPNTGSAPQIPMAELTKPTPVLARRYGVCWEVIYRQRKKHGIKSPKGRKAPTGHITQATRADIRPYLGRYPDVLIAEEFGLTREYIGQLRAVNGIDKPLSAREILRSQLRAERTQKEAV